MNKENLTIICSTIILLTILSIIAVFVRDILSYALPLILVLILCISLEDDKK